MGEYGFLISEKWSSFLFEASNFGHISCSFVHLGKIVSVEFIGDNCRENTEE